MMQPPPHQQQHQQHLDPTTLHDDTAAAAACRIDGRTGSEYRHYTIRHHSMNDDHHDQHSISSSSCTTLLLPSTFSSTFSDGCSELYDTLTHGTVLHLVCHVWAEFQSATTTSSTTSSSSSNSTTAPLVDISIQQQLQPTTTTTSMDQSRMTTTECETALQQYYVPCLRKSLVSLLSLPSSSTDAVVVPSNNNNNNNNNNTPSLWKLQIWVQIISSTSTTSTSTSTSTLDAMVQVINAALLHTMVLPDPTTTTLVPQPLLSVPSFSPHEDDPTTTSFIRLPMVITTHVRLLGDHVILWADASTDEVSDVAVHVVVESTTTATASAVWITPRQLRGSSHHHHDGKLTPRIVQKCVTYTLQVLAPNMTSYFCSSPPPP